MNKIILMPLAGLALAATPAQAQDIGGILSSVLGGGYSQPSYGYEESYPYQTYGQDYGPSYSYGRSYSYQPAYSYQRRYAYNYGRPSYASYGYPGYARYSYPRYRDRHVAYWHHPHRHHYRSYAYAYGRRHRWG